MTTQKYVLKWATAPYELQQEMLDFMYGKHLNNQGNEYRFFIAALGRQSGKSWLARRALLDRANNFGETCMWVAPVIPAALDHWTALTDELEASGLPVKSIKQQSKQIFFHGGGSIRVRSAHIPDNLRGTAPHLIVMDEAAFYAQGEYTWYQVVQPMITATRGKVLFPTTPNGRNWLYPIFMRGMSGDDKYYKSWNFSSYASPFQDKELLDELKKTMPTLAWREEYMAEFLVDGGGVFSGVEEASVIGLIRRPVHGHTYVAGIDFGFVKDNTAFTVLDKYTREQVYGEAFTNIGTIRTIKRLVELLDVWMPEITHIESNGIGLPLFDILREVASGYDIEDIVEYINSRVEDPEGTELEDVIGGHRLRAVHVDNRMKRDMVERVAADIEYGRLQLLSDDCSYGMLQMSEMSTYERRRTITGTEVTYAAASEYHDDTVKAIYLANKGMPKPKRWKLPTGKEEKPQVQRGSPFRSRSLGAKRHRNRRNYARSDRVRTTDRHRA